jgi:hypothetical protein
MPTAREMTMKLHPLPSPEKRIQESEREEET